ncbi:hypothetical protein Pen01_71950 [Phytomonospora endophytica]|nr:hypothetical protein Pen01_71950 [Phytomonospora endophytica]
MFACSGCDTELTTALTRVALPVHAHQRYGNATRLPTLMASGTFAVDPEPSGPPSRRWAEIDPREAAARGVHAPVFALSYGDPGAIVVAPGDIHGTVLIPSKTSGYCCGLDGGDGPNLACEVCDLPVATRIDDCSYWQSAWLDPKAVRALPTGAKAPPPTWDELLASGESTPPLEVISTWNGGLRLDHRWSWSPRWEAAAGRALAHLLAASDGSAVIVPTGMAAEAFQRVLDALLPAAPPALRAAPAGPGLPNQDAEILLVPEHPNTGTPWDGGDPTTVRVPLPFGIWRWLAFPRPDLPLLASGRLPDDVLRDDPAPPRPGRLFGPDWDVFHATLVRLPAVRLPWLRAILDDIDTETRHRLF